jgi:hypothetical protein
MSEQSEGQVSDTTATDELASLLVKRGKKGRARSTSILIGVLLLLLGVFIGIGLGRATAPASDGGPGTSQPGEPPRGGPFGGRPRR